MRLLGFGVCRVQCYYCRDSFNYIVVVRQEGEAGDQKAREREAMLQAGTNPERGRAHEGLAGGLVRTGHGAGGRSGCTKIALQESKNPLPSTSLVFQNCLKVQAVPKSWRDEKSKKQGKKQYALRNQ